MALNYFNFNQMSRLERLLVLRQRP